MYYKHYKGKYYQLLGIVRNTHTEEDMVCYKTLYENPIEYFVRNKSEFFEVLDNLNPPRPRFAPVQKEDLPQDVLLYAVPIGWEGGDV